ncbi:S1 family peptidase [Vibrio caribbeanicus]|uniref:Secreted trypsin-like serine protease n=1 Tax=Vibrio caribbeanicus ATCC BAA-2122 TaxID=796620 RepID=E3BE85_9VIBR|nr:serine protease [Vibrio caribbeanicus]EFP98502.1 secreted trypsin-like serine protease [Vibrio caribbeanicus ATCC BAA-2122]
MNKKRFVLASCFATTCAVSVSQAFASGIEPRIIGGGDAVKSKWPFMVSLANKSSLSGFCGASFLGGRYILTAAHCLVKKNGHVKNPSDIKAYVGAYNLTNGTADKYSDIAAVYIYPAYDASRFKNDIAILELVQPISSASASASASTIAAAPTIKGDLDVAGWGKTRANDNNSSPYILQEVEVPYVDHGTCTNLGNNYSNIDERTAFCAGHPAGGRDSCQGDSGGPIINDLNKQVGIVSWGDGCAKADAYGVYTRVQAFNDWIENSKSDISYQQVHILPSKEGVHQVDVEFTNLSSKAYAGLDFNLPSGVTQESLDCNVAPNGKCNVRFKVNASEALATSDKVVIPMESVKEGATKQNPSLVIGTNVFNVKRSEPVNTPKGGGGGSTSLGFVLLSVLALFTRRFK